MMLSCVILFLAITVGGDDEIPDKCYVARSESGFLDSKLCISQSTGLIYEVEPENEETDLTFDTDTMFIILCGFLVFLMQVGFAMLEAGAVHPKNMQNILYKNLMDFSLGCLIFYLVGYGFAYGDENDGPFIGSSNFALMPGFNGLHRHWFFQWTYAATAATIVSGAVAERCRLYAYFGYTGYLTAWVYPVVAHWVWDRQGWLHQMGIIDYAGSSAVHLVGGVSGFIGSVWLGPRWDTFNAKTFEPNIKEDKAHQSLLKILGTLILWFGFYGFDAGAAIGITNDYDVISRSVICASLSAGTAGATSACLSWVLYSKHNLSTLFNSILTGLVAACASAASIEPYMAIPIGFVAALLYHSISVAMLASKVDDPVDVVAIHGGGGFWGILSAGIFSSPKLIDEVYTHTSGTVYLSGKQFGVQLLGAICIITWALVNGLIIFGCMKRFFGIRVSIEVEKLGLDLAEHGGMMLNNFSGSFKKLDLSSLTEEFTKQAEKSRLAIKSPVKVIPPRQTPVTTPVAGIVPTIEEKDWDY